MELVVFVGIQATGKSSFYRERFYRTHVRINLDMLRTRHRERILCEACLRAQQAFVVDNTNVTKAERANYILPAKAAGFRVVGFFFRSRVAEALLRNASRPEVDRVPDKAIHGMSGRMELPNLEEGFDALHFVQLTEGEQFVVEPWTEKPRIADSEHNTRGESPTP